MQSNVHGGGGEPRWPRSEGTQTPCQPAAGPLSPNHSGAEARLRVTWGQRRVWTPHGSRHVRGREARPPPNPSVPRAPNRPPVSSGAAARQRSLSGFLRAKQRTHALRGRSRPGPLCPGEGVVPPSASSPSRPPGSQARRSRGRGQLLGTGGRGRRTPTRALPAQAEPGACKRPFEQLRLGPGRPSFPDPPSAGGGGLASHWHRGAPGRAHSGQLQVQGEPWRSQVWRLLRKLREERPSWGSPEGPPPTAGQSRCPRRGTQPEDRTCTTESLQGSASGVSLGVRWWGRFCFSC